MKNIVRIAVLTFIFSILFSSVYLSAECSEISNEVLRLHILANSNSEQDQELKLKLRDFLLKETENVFKNCKTKEESIVSANENLSDIEKLSNEFIKTQGFDYKVKVELEEVYFNTRVYDSFAMPPGKYNALRVLIGSGEGHNWWCVMYPPVCLPSAESTEKLDQVLDENQMEIIENEPKYEIKFKIFEVYDAIESFFKSF